MNDYLLVRTKFPLKHMSPYIYNPDSENPFTRFRDSMNGYLLVRTKFPLKHMSPYIYNPDSGSSTLEEVQAGIMSFKFHSCDEDSVEFEEEEDKGMADDMQVGEVFNAMQAHQVEDVNNDDGEIADDYEVEALPDRIIYSLQLTSGNIPD
jgi:hypothetical protein